MSPLCCLLLVLRLPPAEKTTFYFVCLCFEVQTTRHICCPNIYRCEVAQHLYFQKSFRYGEDHDVCAEKVDLRAGELVLYRRSSSEVSTQEYGGIRGNE